MDTTRSASPINNDFEDSCDSEDRHEMESYLYSLVHHDTSSEKEVPVAVTQESIPLVDSGAPPEQSTMPFPSGSLPSERRNYPPTRNIRARYFDTAPNQNRSCLNSVRSLEKPRALRPNPLFEKRGSETVSQNQLLSKEGGVPPQNSIAPFPRSDSPHQQSNAPFPRGDASHDLKRKRPDQKVQKKYCREQDTSYMNFIKSLQNSPPTNKVSEAVTRESMPVGRNGALAKDRNLSSEQGIQRNPNQNSKLDKCYINFCKRLRDSNSLPVHQTASTIIPNQSKFTANLSQVDPDNDTNTLVNTKSLNDGTSTTKKSTVVTERQPSSNEKDTHFELPTVNTGLKTRSKTCQNLNDSMTQVLGTMLDEDASRSSVDSERRHETNQRLRECTRSNSGPGWTVAMSWDDMSSKHRFNFEDDSVCGESAREGSTTPAESRATTPEAAAPSTPLTSPTPPTSPISPTTSSFPIPPTPPTPPTPDDDVTKYVVLMKSKRTKNNPLAETESESDAESVVEVAPPVKEPPLVVEIESDGEDEDETPPKKSKVSDEPEEDNKTEIEEDIVIVFETGNNQPNCVPSPSTISPEPAATIIETEIASPKSQNEPVRQSPGNKRQRVDVANKTRSPAEHLDIERILAGMSDDPALWRICRQDMFPPRAASRRVFPPCRNCKQRDHAFYRCPEPPKLKVCHMCGAPGHTHRACPEGRCLSCGKRPPPHLASKFGFSKMCIACASRRKGNICQVCKMDVHNPGDCPDIWRRYHYTTTAGPPVVPPMPDLRAQWEIWCCNCAKKGHHSHQCQRPCSQYNKNIFTGVVSYNNLNVNSKYGTPFQSIPKPAPRVPAKSTQVDVTTSSCSTENLDVQEVPSTSAEHDEQPPPEVTVATENHNPSLRPASASFEQNMREIRKISTRICLPKDREKLVKFLEAELFCLQKRSSMSGPHLKIWYNKFLRHLSSDSKKRKGKLGKAMKCVRKLNIILYQHFGIDRSKSQIDHVGKLEEGFKILLNKTGRVSNKFRRDLSVHYNAVFRFVRKDLGNLVEMYCRKKNNMAPVGIV